jgi:hypothetical protein
MVCTTELGKSGESADCSQRGDISAAEKKAYIAAVQCEYNLLLCLSIGVY